MKRLSKKQIGRAACTILQQLALTTPLNVVYSWGVTNKVATQIEITVDGMEKNVAALMMDVNGFNYQGRLYVTNNRVKQTFGLYSEQNGMLHAALPICFLLNLFIFQSGYAKGKAVNLTPCGKY